MIERIDKDWWRGKQNDYRDDGPVTPGAKTRRFSIFMRKGRTLMGYIKWFGMHRGYSLFPLNSVFHPDNLAEIAEFCQDATRVHNDRRPPPKVKKLIHRPPLFEQTINRGVREERRQEATRQANLVSGLEDVHNGLMDGSD